MVSLWICVNLGAGTDNDKEYAGSETHELGIEPLSVTLMLYEIYNFNFNYFYLLTIGLRAGGQGVGS